MTPVKTLLNKRSFFVENAMCDCIDKLEEKVKEHVVENKQFRKQVVSVSMRGKIISLSDGFKERLSSDFEIELEGQKKREAMPVTWSYCAFCGEKIET